MDVRYGCKIQYRYKIQMQNTDVNTDVNYKYKI